MLLFLTVILDYGLGAPVVLTIDCVRNFHSEDEEMCTINEWKHSDAKEITYNFNVDFAKPENIRLMKIMKHYDFGPILTVEHIAPEIFATFPNLESFRMRTNLTAVRAGDFAHAMNLRGIQLDKNNIKIVERFTQKPINSNETAIDTRCELHKLEHLNLQRNEIDELPDYTFYGLDKLIELSLSNNKLKEIRRDTFNGLTSLKTLNLAFNYIVTIADDALAFPALEELKLQGNNLKVLSDNVFKHLQRLEKINVGYNRLEHIGQAFAGLPVREIRLTENNIVDANLAVFARLSKLDDLSLTENGFTFAATQSDDQEQWNSPLRTLRIGSPNTTDPSELKKLKIFPHLKTIDLSDSNFPNFKIDGEQTLKDILPALKNVVLNDMACGKVQRLANELLKMNVTVSDSCSDDYYGD